MNINFTVSGFCNHVLLTQLLHAAVSISPTHHLSLSLPPLSVHQAQSAVKIGLDKLREHDIPISRPEDYFAEMVKSDDHMRKVE